LGLLHDAVILRLVWEPGERILRFEIKDLYCNFFGLPEYHGAVPGSIELRELSRVEFDIEMSEKQLNIHEFLGDAIDSGEYRITVTFWPVGKVIAVCRSADFPEINFNK
jgi:hypothetical protein